MRASRVLSGLVLATAMLIGCSTDGPRLAAPSQTAAPATPPSPSSTALASPTTTPSPSVATRTSHSGIEGRTLVDGGCPVEIERSPCPPKPISARVTAVHAATGVDVASATSGADGRFRIELEPGRYWLKATNLTGAPFPRSSPVPVVVDSARYATVTVAFDSGIQ